MAAANSSRIYKRLLGIDPLEDGVHRAAAAAAAAANDGLRNTQPINPAAATTSPASSVPASKANTPARAASARGPVPSTDASSYPVDVDAAAATSPASSTAKETSATKATSEANAAAFAASYEDCDASKENRVTNTDVAVLTNQKESDLSAEVAHQEEKLNFHNIATTNVDVSMKHYASNLLHLVEDISSRFLMLEKRTGCLESAVGMLISKAETTAECSMQIPDLKMTGKSESGPCLTQLQGILNQGGTCYLNSIVQTLFHLPLFREIICQIEDIPQGGAASALKDVFYQMKDGSKPACTSKLTASLGWSAKNHEDVVEKFEELLHKLIMVPGLKNVIEDLFGGSILQTDRCIKTEQPFYVLRLEVEGCKNVRTSFEQIVMKELTAADAKADPNNFQEATEIPLFGHLPPILVLQLGRFVTTASKKEYKKLNDRYEFPLELDLDIQGLSVASEKNTSKIYMLHSVHVHKGGTRSGHNFVFIRPTLSNGWYKYDDHVVTNATEDMALEEQYGGHEGPSAYMLVYIRKTDNEKLMCNNNNKDLESIVSTYQSSIPYHVEINVGHPDEFKEQPRLSKSGFSEFLYSVRVFASNYLDFGLVVNNLLAYSGFHILLLGLDLLIEMRLKSKIFISMWEGLCWLIAVSLHVWIIRWINNKSHKREMQLDSTHSPIHQLEAMLDPELSIGKIANPITYIRDFRIKLRNLVASIKKEERYEDFMLFLLALTRWIFAVLKEVTSEKIGRGFLGLLLAHAGAMAIELIGAFAAFRFIHKKSGSWFSLEWML